MHNMSSPCPHSRCTPAHIADPTTILGVSDGEVGQMLPMHMDMMKGELDLGAYPNITAWAGRMAKLPHHDAVHASLATLGSFSAPSDTPVMKRLAGATKAGLKALTAAQQGSKL